MGPLFKYLIGFRFGAGRRINLLQLADGKRSLLRIWSLERRIKIGQIRLPVPQLLDDQPHLKSPVAQMNVADHMVSQEFSQTLYALANYRRAQVSHMKRLGHIGPAVVHNDGFFFLRLLHSKLRGGRHFSHIARQEFL